MPWQPKYQGKVAILDDYREGISLGLMKNGIFDLNTTSKAQIDLSRQTLQDLVRLVNVHIDNNDYTEIPDGQTWIHTPGPATWRRPRTTCPRARRWRSSATGSPPTGAGRWPTTPTPCCAQPPTRCSRTLFLNYLLDLPNVLENISFNGYMQPLNEITPQRLVKEKLLPPSLMSTAVLPSYFRRGVGELQLPVDADALWQQAWLVASNGI